MVKLSSVLALVLACLAAGSARAAEFGANDDTGKFLAGSSGGFYAGMASVGLKTNVITLRWDPALPDAIPDRMELDAALPKAQEAGVRIVFALYGARPTVFTDEGAAPEDFAAWVTLVATTYPQVTEYVIGNEPNQPRFWRPQFDWDGQQASAAAFGPVLAASYDALKAIDPAITVVGLGLSPRGNDRPNARDNVSTSPVRFLKALGDWYRLSGRRLPLMDALGFHPYPSSNRDGLERGYVWPNAGVADLGRIKLAIWDAFAKTPQPTTANGLKLYLDELGWQVDTQASAAYTGWENVAVTDEITQARIYGRLVRLLACDPSVAAVNLFGFRDQSDRFGFQAGLQRADGTPRPAAGAVAAALEETGGACLGELKGWRVTRGVVGASVSFAGAGFTATAREEATYRAGLFRAGTASTRIERELTSRRSSLSTKTGLLRANRWPRVTLSTRVLRPGRYVLAVRLVAWANPKRASVFVSRPLAVARPVRQRP
jgi:hypothetical protein